MDAEVISFAERRASRRHPVLDRVETYWDGLRNGRNAPSRAEVNPRGLPQVLGHCFILERIAPGMGRFRVCGQHISKLMGMDLIGLPFSAILLPEARDSFETTLERVYQDSATARLSMVSPKGYRRPAMEGQLLLLPLRDDLGQVTRVLGCLAMDGERGRPPRRLDISQTVLRDLGKPFPARYRGTSPEDAGRVVELHGPASKSVEPAV